MVRTVEWYVGNQAWVRRVLDGSYRMDRIGLPG
jgi:dTDP-glucose 4,6-dehydratase